MNSGNLTRWKQSAKRLKSMVYVLYLARKDPRVPWYAKVLTVLVVGYALSPVDLIPDLIPVLGYLDDALLLPLGIALIAKLIPREVIEEYEEKARRDIRDGTPRSWVAGSIIILVWILGILLFASWLSRAFG